MHTQLHMYVLNFHIWLSANIRELQCSQNRMAVRPDSLMPPGEVLDTHCSDVHLMEIGLKLTDWRVVAMLLGLEDTEMEDIEEKARSPRERALRMLKRWRQKLGEGATYRYITSLILIFIAF